MVLEIECDGHTSIGNERPTELTDEACWLV